MYFDSTTPIRCIFYTDTMISEVQRVYEFRPLSSVQSSCRSVAPVAHSRCSQSGSVCEDINNVSVRGPESDCADCTIRLLSVLVPLIPK